MKDVNELWWAPEESGGKRQLASDLKPRDQRETKTESTDYSKEMHSECTARCAHYNT